MDANTTFTMSASYIRATNLVRITDIMELKDHLRARISDITLMSWTWWYPHQGLRAWDTNLLLSWTDRVLPFSPENWSRRCNETTNHSWDSATKLRIYKWVIYKWLGFQVGEIVIYQLQLKFNWKIGNLQVARCRKAPSREWGLFFSMCVVRIER